MSLPSRGPFGQHNNSVADNYVLSIDRTRNSQAGYPDPYAYFIPVRVHIYQCLRRKIAALLITSKNNRKKKRPKHTQAPDAYYCQTG
ncbi:MAG: hypothetical protein JSU01_01535 [Bacteroidetes bacterium]|nr:hypothetical protein [Bacteroidota bacterium]